MGLVGTAASLIGLLLAVFFYYTGRRTRNLVAYVHPLMTTVVKSGQSSNLKVLHNGREITSDVTAVQFAIWNQGQESIRSEHILREITIMTKPRVPLLEAKVIKGGRHVTRFSLDESHLAEGLLGLPWRILEHNDGAVVQLIHAGPPETELVIDGVIEGQSAIVIRAPKLTLVPQPTSPGPGSLAIALAVAGLACLSLIPARSTMARVLARLPPHFGDEKRERISAARILKVELIVFAVGLMLAAAYFLIRFVGEPSPPFSF